MSCFARAELHGDRIGCTFLEDGESREASLTYAELDRRARWIGGWLRAHGTTGKPVLLVYPQGLEFITAFFGCLYAGAIAVPAYPPRRNRRATRICCMISDANVEIALTTNELLEQMDRTIKEDPILSGPRWQSTDTLDEAWIDAWQRPDPDPESLAFLQYTSGSIGTPKGVMVTHGNLLENQRLICHSFCQTEKIVVVGWLPLHHDMGLIGNMLHPLYLGGRFVFMSPVAFLQQPIRWVRAMSKYRATIGGGPNFGYELCVTSTSEQQRESLDLSPLEVAFTGAERVQNSTLKQFEDAFAPYGFKREAFCPCYGLAETTLITSGSVMGEPVVTTCVDAKALSQRQIVPASEDPNQDNVPNQDGSDSDGKPIDLVSCGIPAPSVDVRIVDPESRVECPANHVGEIWVAGDTVARGYWGPSELTDECFGATLSENADDCSTRFLRTGDLGFLREGHLYIAGRLKDLIIVRGGNHYPSDIEQTTSSSHPCLISGSCAAFGIDVQDEERVVVIQEVQRSHLRTFDHDEVCNAIRQSIIEDHLVPLHAIVLVRPGSVPKTTSGKIQRREARRMYLEGGFKAVAAWESTDSSAADEHPSGEAEIEPCNAVPPPHEVDRLTVTERDQVWDLQHWVLARLAERLGVPAQSIDANQPFARYGIDSLKAVRMTGELEEHLGRSIPPTLLYDYPNVAALVRYLVLGETSVRPIRPLPSAGDESLAVVGIGCRFPGSHNAATFWDLLCEGRDGIGPVPIDRWGEALQRLSEAGGGKRPSVTRGGFIDAVDQFDAGLFGINPREADEMDPQQRMLLQVTWEAFEHAGIALDQLAGSRTGVFFGVSANDYGHLQSTCGHQPNIYRATGNSLAVIANRVSFLFDFQGPSWAVDTACSSSLVAVHHGCVSLRRGECDTAVVGGVSLILSPETTASLSQAGMLSATGRCHAFSAAADGFVRGEGCGVLLLKRLSDARAHGDRILCVLRGSAVNQDGRSNGLTAPNGVAQQAVLRGALADARLEPAEIDYIEAHGTGTALGDPIEMGALGAVFADHRAPGRPLLVGSVKTNIGHLEGAAGIAGLIKACLAVQHGTVPPNLHYETPSPHIDWSLPVEVPVTPTDWPATERPRRAGVSSFGFGGTNAHVILEQAPAPADHAAAEPDDASAGPQLLTLSAKTPTALAALATRFADRLPAAPLADIGYTAACGRSHFPYRLALVADQRPQVVARLRQFARQGEADGLVRGQAPRDFAAAFVCGGQGHRCPGAGRQLYERDPTFRHHLDHCREVAAEFWPQDIRTILWDDAARWDQVDVQPALLCLQVSLGRFWSALGLQPAVLLGHSLGEYAAACLAGVFSLEDALRLVTRRARLLRERCRPGRMLAVLADEDQVRPLLEGLETRVDIAALNGPRQTVVSGTEDALAEVEARLGRLRARPLAATHAFHSPLVEPMLEPFAEAARQVTYARPRVALVSALLGRRVDAEVTDPDYWCRHLRRPVRFADALSHLGGTDSGGTGSASAHSGSLSTGEAGATHGGASAHSDSLNTGEASATPQVVLELGAGTTVAALVRAATRDRDLCVLKGLSGDDREWKGYLQQLAQLYVHGAPLAWQAVWPTPRTRPTLPTYPFEQQRYWFTGTPRAAAPATSQPAAAPATPAGTDVHPLLGRRLDLAGREIVYENDLATLDYLKDHRLAGATVFPAAGYLELALAAGRDAGFKLPDVRDLKIRRPLTIDDHQACRVQVVLAPDDDGFKCRILRQQPDKWQTHATCRLSPEIEPLNAQPFPPTAGEPRAVETLYAQFRQLGLDYGPAFQGLRKLWHTPGRAWGEVTLPNPRRHHGYLVHPALLDACFQVTAGALETHQAEAWIPVRIDRFRIANATPHETLPPTDLRVYVEFQSEANETSLNLNLHATDKDEQFHMVITGLRLKKGSTAGTTNLVFRDQWVHVLRDRESPTRSSTSSVADIAGRLVRRREAIARQTGLAEHTKALDTLESLSGHFVYRALAAEGLLSTPGDSFRTSELADTLGITSDNRRLLHRLLCMLEEDGYLFRSDDRWTVKRIGELPDLRSATHQLLEKYPTAKTELSLLQRCADRLLTVMRGECDPLTLLFPSDGSISAADLYRDSIGGQAVNALIGEAIAQIGESLPDGRGLRILEIGAGTGATTEAVFERTASNRVRYVFTDIAASFLPAAKARFRSHENIEYRVLDIERDPATQGLEPAQFDVVVAANVLHATKSIEDSLTHIHRLMVPGGKLVVLEGTRPVRWLDLTFGLTRGWWRFDDTRLRPDYPLLSADLWHQVLDLTGFHATQIIQPLPTSEAGREPENSVIVSEPRELVSADIDNSQSHARRQLLVFADGTGVGERLASQLEKDGYSTVVTRRTEHFATSTEPANGTDSGELSVDSIRTLIDSAPEADGVVFMWTLDSPDDPAATRQQAHELNQTLLGVAQTIADRRNHHVGAAEGMHQKLTFWVVTQNAQLSDDCGPSILAQASTWGFVRTLALEHQHWDCRIIDLDPGAAIDASATTLADEINGSANSNESEIVFRNGVRLARRLVHADDRQHVSSPDESSTLTIASRGTLDGLRLDRQTRRAPNAEEIEVEVHAAGLNFRDVLNVLGQYPGTPPLGAECSGVVARVGSSVAGLRVGDRVAVIAPGSFSDFLTVREHLAVKVPDNLSLEDVATVPIAFLTASVALESLGKVKRGDRVLIHAATGGVGLAAVQIALDAGAEVFASASVAKQGVLRELGITHVYDSRRSGFANRILEATSGDGVALILNTLSDDFITENLQALGANGHYVDITKTTAAGSHPAMQSRTDVAYDQFDLAALLESDADRVRKELNALVSRISAGHLKPLPHICFPLHAARDAFRFMRSARHVGKILIQPRKAVDPDAIHGSNSVESPKSTGESLLRNDANYLITGGLGGLGLEIARWMTTHGARHISLLARREPNEAEREKISRISGSGVSVSLLRADVARRDEVDAALSQLRENGLPLAGVFHLAGLLDDGLVVRQTPEKMARVFAPKISGAWNLHRATLADSLDHFVLFSSAAAVFGSAGQANHSAANAFLDALARYRQSEGRPALSINWGPWSDIGAAASRGVEKRADLSGIGMITPEEGIAILENAMRGHAAQVAALRLEIDKLPAKWKELPLFELLLARETEAAAGPQCHSKFLAEYKTTPAGQKQHRLATHFQTLVAGTLGIQDHRSIPLDEALSDLGLDSLASLELCNHIEESLNTTVSPTLVFDYPTLNDLVAYFMGRLPAEDLPSAPQSKQESKENESMAADLYVSQSGTADQIGRNGENSDVGNDQNATEVLRSIRELSRELDCWEEVD